VVVGEAIAGGTGELAVSSTFFPIPFVPTPGSYYSPCHKSKKLSAVLSIIVDLATRVQPSQCTIEITMEVKYMRNMKLGLLALPLCVLVFTGAQAGAAPFSWSLVTPVPAQEQQKPNQPQQPTPNQPQTPPDQTQPAPGQDQPKQDQAQATTFTGTIVKDGEQFLLHATSGGIYKLDDSTRAQAFEGKSVKVTGKLDTDAKLIHVENIEAVSA
jgi:hypothetical protein